MAKKCYVGVNGVARKVKKGYVGVGVTTPIYDEKIETANITASNLAEYFTVTNGTYYFAGNGSTFTSNNKGVDNSSATSTWTAKYDMSAVSFSYSVSSESNYDKLTIVVKGSTVASAISGTSNSTWSGSLSAGDTISLTFIKDNGSASGNDCGTLSAMSITATVKTQIGVETKGIARKIKKAYVGIGGVARPCWSGGELAYYGTATALSTGRIYHAATSVGNYVLFGGGTGNSGQLSTVEAYNKTLTRSDATALSEARTELAATTVGSYAIFGGGGNVPTSKVDAYNTSLTKSTPTSLGYGRRDLAATTVGNYAIFGGGNNSAHYNNTDAYNTSLTRTSPTTLSEARSYLSALTVGGYAIFAGGKNSVWNPTTVDAYNTSLTRSAPTALANGRAYMAAATVGEYALFAGGVTTGYVTTVEAYNTSLTKSTPTALSKARGYFTATSVGNYALFGGGIQYGCTVDAYDASLTRTLPTELSSATGTARISNLAAGSIGDYALFTGGNDNNFNYLTTVDVYTVA